MLEDDKIFLSCCVFCIWTTQNALQSVDSSSLKVSLGEHKLPNPSVICVLPTNTIDSMCFLFVKKKQKSFVFMLSVVLMWFFKYVSVFVLCPLSLVPGHQDESIIKCNNSPIHTRCKLL